MPRRSWLEASRSNAKDLAQETWARLWEQACAGKLGRIDLPGLALRQAGFLASDDARRRARAAAHGADSEAPGETMSDAVDPSVMPDEQIVARERIGRATFEWIPCEVVFDVPERGSSIQIGTGYRGDGSGTVWLDDVVLEEVDRGVQVTGDVRDETAPANLGFEPG